MKELPPEGWYVPSFFHIRISTEADVLKFNEDEYFQTVVHEYIHFLQDIFTTFGIARSTIAYDLIAHLYNAPDHTIELPINIPTLFGRNNCTSINNKLYHYYENRVSNDSFGLKINRLQFNDIRIESSKENVANRFITTYTVVLLKDGIEVTNFPFGASCILECMAALFENHLYPRKSETYWIPYDLPNIVIEYKYPAFNNQKFLFTLCCTALMGYNSPDLFLNILNSLSSNQIPVLGISSLDKYVRADQGSLEHIFYEVRNQLKEATINIFNVDVANFYGARDWAIHWLESVKNPYLFFDNLINLFDVDAVDAKSKFKNIINQQVSPIISNSNGELCIMGNNKEILDYSSISIWLYLKNMYNYVFQEGDTCCCNCDICDAQGNFQDECLNSPLSNRIGKKPYCIFRQIYQMWGLYRHNVRKGEDFINPIPLT